MTHLPIISGNECIKALCRAGFSIVRQKGSHIVVRRNNPFSQIVVPEHKVLDRGTLRSIIRQSGLSIEDFNKYL